MKKYRIVVDTFGGFEVQVKSWWLPFWYQACFTNTHSNIDSAQKYIEKLKKKGNIVYED